MFKLTLGAAAVASSLTLAAADAGKDDSGSSEGSSVSCSISSFASSVSVSQDAFVAFGAEIGKYVCDDDVSIEVTATQNAIAQAVAEAVAFSSIECTIDGEGSVDGTVTSKAAANASANAVALGEGFASVETCTGCMAAVDLFVEASEAVFLSAIAESEATLEEFNDASGRAKVVKRAELVEDIQSKILDTYVTIVLDVTAAEDECGVSVEGCAVAGSAVACCDISVDNAANEISTSAIAEAGASANAQALTCGTDDEDLEASEYAEAVAEATALAYAEALTEAHGYCMANGDSSACTFIEASIEALASAQATAWAGSFATASNDCGCSIESAALATSVKSIFAKATTQIIADVCAVGDDTFADIDTVVNAFEDEQVVAIASAVASAAADGTGCRTFNNACATSGESQACCSISVDNAADSFAEDAFVGFETVAAVYLCTDGVAEVELDVVAEAFGIAWAKVITAVNAFCFSSGSASACSLVDSDVRAVAQAEAQAIVQLWAGTVDEDCGCSVNVDLTVEAVVDVMVEATLSVFGAICVEGEAFENVSLFLQAFEESNFEAFAGLFVRVKKEMIDGDSTCEVAAVVDVDVTEETVSGELCADCAARNQKCLDRSFKDDEGNPLVKGCCDVEQHCIRRNHRVGLCRDVERGVPDGWDGEVLTCTQEQ